MTIVMESSALTRGLADIATAAEKLDSARGASNRRVEALLAGWHGEAAESFAAAYAEWAEAALDVRARLEDLRAGVDSARSSLDDADGASAAGVSRIADRLG